MRRVVMKSDLRIGQLHEIRVGGNTFKNLGVLAAEKRQEDLVIRGKCHLVTHSKLPF